MCISHMARQECQRIRAILAGELHGDTFEMGTFESVRGGSNSEWKKEWEEKKWKKPIVRYATLLPRFALGGNSDICPVRMKNTPLVSG